jgi:hypothetical protein
VTVTLVPVGRGRWSPLVLRWDAKCRRELPPPVSIRPGDRVPVLGQMYRVVRVEG